MCGRVNNGCFSNAWADAFIVGFLTCAYINIVFLRLEGDVFTIVIFSLADTSLNVSSHVRMC